MDILMNSELDIIKIDLLYENKHFECKFVLMKISIQTLKKICVLG